PPRRSSDLYGPCRKKAPHRSPASGAPCHPCACALVSVFCRSLFSHLVGRFLRGRLSRFFGRFLGRLLGNVLSSLVCAVGFLSGLLGRFSLRRVSFFGGLGFRLRRQRLEAGQEGRS